MEINMPEKLHREVIRAAALLQALDASLDQCQALLAIYKGLKHLIHPPEGTHKDWITTELVAYQDQFISLCASIPKLSSMLELYREADKLEITNPKFQVLKDSDPQEYQRATKRLRELKRETDFNEISLRVREIRLNKARRNEELRRREHELVIALSAAIEVVVALSREYDRGNIISEHDIEQARDSRDQIESKLLEVRSEQEALMFLREI